MSKGKVAKTLRKQLSAKHIHLLRSFQRAMYKEDILFMASDKADVLLETKEQEDILMDMADILEPDWHRKYDDNNPSGEDHWLYKFVRTKLFRLL